VEGKVALIFDDMISTAGSICAAANIVHQFGAREIHIAATHGVLCGKAVERLMAAPVESIVITDTIPLSTDKRNRLGSKLKQLSVSRLLGEAIRRIHHDLSISAMFNEMEGQLLN
jgi:ribose-phosphate pyrophosphokinase